MSDGELGLGSIVGGDLRIVRPIQVGVLATVFEAESVADGAGAEHVALKVVTATIGKDARFRELFAAEARRLERVASDGIMPVTRAGVDDTLDVPFAVSPLLRGEALSTWRARYERVEPALARAVIEAIARALAALHDAGVVHRDLKPDSIFIDDSGGAPNVHLSCLGVSKLASEAKRNTTAAMSRPLWMAPEQAETDVVVTPATDVWSFGLLAYYVYTGHVFWRAGRDAGSAMMSLLREVLYDAIPAASARAREQGVAERLPSGFDAWFARACARDRQQRFQHARDAMTAMAAPADAPPPAPPASLGQAPLGRPKGIEPASAPPSLRRRPKRLVLALVGALAAVTLVAGGLVYYLVQRANDASRREASRGGDDDRRHDDKPKKPRPIAVSWNDLDCPLPVSSRDPTWGDRDAPVTVVAFTSFDCRACAKTDSELAALRHEYGEKRVRIVWKTRIDPRLSAPKLPPALPPFSPGPGEPKSPPSAAPTEAPEGERAIKAAVAGQAVFEAVGSAGFWAFEESAMGNPGRLSDVDRASYAVAAGAPRDKYQSRLLGQSPETGKLAEDGELATRAGVTAPGRLFINGRAVDRAAPLAKIETMIDEAEQEAALEREAGTPADHVYVRLASRHYAPALPEPATTDGSSEDDSVYRVPVGDSPAIGPKDALITIVELGDYECPFTRQLESTLALVRDESPADVRLVWKDNPLPQHTRAEPAAELAREVRAQLGMDAFWTTHERLLRIGSFDESDLRFDAEMAGIDPDGAVAAISASKHKSTIAKDQALAADLDETSTPTLFINGRKLKGAVSLERVKAAVAAERKRAETELQRGTSRDALYDALTKDGKMPGAFQFRPAGALPRDAPRTGAKKPKVVVVEYGDLQCSTCGDLDAELRTLVAEHPDKAALIFRNRPDHARSSAELTAEAGLEVKAQLGDDGFWHFHDKVLAASRISGDLTRDQIEAIAKDVGCDTAKLRDALDKKSHKDAVEADAKAASDLGISTTPLALVGGYVITGDRQSWRVRRAFERALFESK